MRDELARATVAVPVASLLGLPLTRTRSSRAGAGVLGALVVLLALADSLHRWQTWAVAVIAGIAAMSMPSRSRQPDSSWQVVSIWVASLTISAGAAAALLIDDGATGHALEVVANEPDVAYVILGALAAVFAGGEIIARIMHPFARRVRATECPPPGMENAGRVIGWLERTLLYALVLAGAPDAAALVIAGKSIARFPAFKTEEFGEYYLIGSLLSLIIAAGAGIAVRAFLGLTPLPARIG
jgi:hypothetical protein